MQRTSAQRKRHLSTAKKILLEQRLRNREARTSRLQQIAASPRPLRIPLSYAQQRLWFIDRLEGTSTEYNMLEALRLKGELGREALERAMNTIIERHESLRTHFEEVDGEPVQVIEAERHLEIPLLDLRKLSREEQEDAVGKAMVREIEEPFDLGCGPVLRIKLLQLGDEEHIVLQTLHHIASDGWSVGVMNRELGILYEAYREGRENPLEPLQVQYADFALWQRESLQDGILPKGLEYWREQLSGIPERLELPTDRPRSAMRNWEAGMCCTDLDAELISQLTHLGRKTETTLYMTLLAGLGVVLGRYSAQHDIAIGTSIANRQAMQLEGLIGFFINRLVLRLRLCAELSFRELLLQVRGTALDAYKYQDIPFERVVEELSPKRSLNMTPLYQVSFTMLNAPRVRRELKGMMLKPVELKKIHVRTDLEIHAFEQKGKLELRWLYSRELFDPWRIEQMARHYVRALKGMAADPDQPLSQVTLLDAEELKEMLEEGNVED